MYFPLNTTFLPPSVVAQAVKHRPGWRVGEAGEPWDVGWSDTNRVVREVSPLAQYREQKE